MSRSKRKNPILCNTTAETEAPEKAKWHRRHRREERARLSSQGEDYVERSHREHSDPWSMEKDGKKYWGDAISSRHMRK
ncbi:hypothetical protein [Paraburkholderia strydomiana]|uniref:Uncharacterized protein n=1 Tax=Paraburkholderia strydomiana TaxID=1245417 RepID=A0ABW9BRZ7_9BURK